MCATAPSLRDWSCPRCPAPGATCRACGVADESLSLLEKRLSRLRRQRSVVRFHRDGLFSDQWSVRSARRDLLGHRSTLAADRIPRSRHPVVMRVCRWTMWVQRSSLRTSCRGFERQRRWMLTHDCAIRGRIAIFPCRIRRDRCAVHHLLQAVCVCHEAVCVWDAAVSPGAAGVAIGYGMVPI